MSIKTPNTGSGKVQGERHPFWKGDNARPNTKRGRARLRYALAACELCGAKATDRHHRDDDTGNNAASNVMKLCRRCHMEIDGRLEALKKLSTDRRGVQLKPSRPCGICGDITIPKRLFEHRCHRCNEFWRRNGFERPATSGNLDRTKPPRPCVVCATVTKPKSLRHGRCIKCTRYWDNYGKERPLDLGHGLRGKRRGLGRYVRGAS